MHVSRLCTEGVVYYIGHLYSMLIMQMISLDYLYIGSMTCSFYFFHISEKKQSALNLLVQHCFQKFCCLIDYDFNYKQNLDDAQILFVNCSDRAVLFYLVGLGSHCENLLQISMGGKSSKTSASGRYSSYSSSSNSWSHQQYPQSYYPQQTGTYSAAPPPQNYGGFSQDSKKKLERKYSRIDDNYNSLDQVKLYIVMYRYGPRQYFCLL